MANAENVALVIGAIKGETEIGFNMASYVCSTSLDLEDKTDRGCNTIACIAGHAYLFATANNPEAAMDEDPDEIELVAGAWLGISEDEARHLFYDLPIGFELKDISAAAAIETLQRLAETGVVKWRLT